MTNKEVATVAKRKPPAAGMGRVKGSLNKTTVAVKTALSMAFDGLGGVDRLTEWAKANETEFYKLWAKMMPTEISGPGGAPIRIQSEVLAAVATLTPGERAALRGIVAKLEEGE